MNLPPRRTPQHTFNAFTHHLWCSYPFLKWSWNCLYFLISYSYLNLITAFILNFKDFVNIMDFTAFALILQYTEGFIILFHNYWTVLLKVLKNSSTHLYLHQNSCHSQSFPSSYLQCSKFSSFVVIVMFCCPLFLFYSSTQLWYLHLQWWYSEWRYLI